MPTRSDLLDPRHRDMLEVIEQVADLPSPLYDPTEAIIAEAGADVPYDLRELSPDIITGDQQ